MSCDTSGSHRENHSIVSLLAPRNAFSASEIRTLDTILFSATAPRGDGSHSGARSSCAIFSAHASMSGHWRLSPACPPSALKSRPRCGPVIEINDSRKNTILARPNHLFEFADLLGLLLDQSADNRMSIAEDPTLNNHTGFRARTPACRRTSSVASVVHDPSYTPLPNTTAS